MCVYPRLIPNKKYLPNKKNGGNPPECKDRRTMVTAIGCGKCFECRAEKAREWKIRMYEEFRGVNEKGESKQYVTMTFSEDALKKYEEIVAEENEGEIDENEVATKAVRHFLERWRKYNKKSLRHWLITELGHEGTERLHLHGVIMSEKPYTKEYLEKIWKNGWVDVGWYCNLRTVNYIIKYVTKVDNKHPDFTGKILCSAGIGNYYFKHGHGKRFNQYIGEDTKEYYRSKEGYKMSLPIYYRNHIYSEKEREELWINKLNLHEIWLDKVKYDISNNEGTKKYQRALKEAQKKNEKLKYGKIEWDWEIYAKSIEKINKTQIRNINIF